jgi:hypothetical protein
MAFRNLIFDITFHQETPCTTLPCQIVRNDLERTFLTQHKGEQKAAVSITPTTTYHLHDKSEKLIATDLYDHIRPD